jgi:hypothetical protein
MVIKRGLIIGSSDEELVVTSLGLQFTELGEQPFTVGQVFAKGDVPSGTDITSDIEQFQADVRNLWDDGSVRYAVLSGIASDGTYELRSGGTPYSAGDVAEPSGFDAVVAFTNVTDPSGSPTSVGGGSFSASLSDARTAGSMAWDRTEPHKVREILGPVMSEFHYFVPTADDHTHVWFYVRAYSDGSTEVETVVQNGWTQVASPGSRTYSVTVTVGGSERYNSGSPQIIQYHHTRWSRIDWVGTDPEVTPTHDRAYLQTTNMLAKMAVTSITSSAYTEDPDAGTKYSAWTRALAEQPTPFEVGNIDPALGAGGFSDNIGPFPVWEMMWLAAGDPRAYWSVLGNARAAGVFCGHYTDEATGRPVKASTYPTLGLNDSDAGWPLTTSTGLLTPTPTGGISSNFNGTGWKFSHGPKMGYLAYLLTGRWRDLETVQHYSAAGGIGKSSYKLDGYPIAPWTQELRTIAHLIDWWGKAAIISPQYLNGTAVTGQEEAQRTEAIGRWSSNTKRYWNTYDADGTPDGGTDEHWQDNALGAWYHNTFDDTTSDPVLGPMVEHSGQQWAFMANAWLWNYIAEVPTTEQAKLEDLVQFTARWPVGMMGATATNPWGDYRLFIFYMMEVGYGQREAAQTPFTSYAAMWTHLNDGGTWQGSPDTNPIPSLPADTVLRVFGIEGHTRSLGSTLPRIPDSSHSNGFVWTVALTYDAHTKISGGISGAQTMADNFYGSASWAASVASTTHDANGMGFQFYPGCAVVALSF